MPGVVIGLALTISYLIAHKTNRLYTWVSAKLNQDVTCTNHVFRGTSVDLVIWVTNYAIYKAHLMAVDGLGMSIFSVAIDLFQLYKSHFPTVVALCSH